MSFVTFLIFLRPKFSMTFQFIKSKFLIVRQSFLFLLNKTFQLTFVHIIIQKLFRKITMQASSVQFSHSVVSDSWDSMDCRPPVSSVYGILQARILVWVTIPFSRGSSDPGTKPRSLTLQADSLLSKLLGKPG